MKKVVGILIVALIFYAVYSAGMAGYAYVTISNLVPSVDGHKHFVHYYTDFLTQVPANERIEIENAGLEIFDCVPPVPLP